MCGHHRRPICSFNPAVGRGMFPVMRFAVLGSGSGGNAAVVEAGGVRVLIDAGLSARQILRRLGTLGLQLQQLDAVLLTHEHGDHVGGLRVLSRQLTAPVFATPSTCAVVRETAAAVRWKIFECGARFTIGGLEVESFPVPHDAVEPVGFVFRSGSGRFGLLSDSGHVTPLIRERLRGVQALFVEANYDDALLEADVKRPWSIKQRIASRHGHLSNAQTAELVLQLAGHGLERVVLGHLSQDCNTPERACEVVGASLAGVCCAGQHEPCGWWQVVSPPPAAVDLAENGPAPDLQRAG